MYICGIIGMMVVALRSFIEIGRGIKTFQNTYSHSNCVVKPSLDLLSGKTR